MFPPFDLSSLLYTAFEEGCTQSEMTTLDNCATLWFWKYGLMLRKKVGFSWPLVYGSAMHDVWEQMYATQGKRWSIPDLGDYIPKGTSLTLQQQADRAYWQGVLEIQAECYAIKYKDDFIAFKTDKVELIVDITIMFEGVPIRLKGMVDLTVCNVASGGRMWMLDHKTTRDLQLSTVMGWDFRFQFMFYLYILYKWEEQNGQENKYAGYYINAMKKPTIKVRQKDTLQDFFERLRNEMLMEPEKYFYRQQLLMNKQSLDYFEQNILGPKLRRIQLLTNPQISDSIKLSIVTNPNTDHCQRYWKPCEFLPLCNHGWGLEGFQYEKRPVKHEELELETSEE
jgi:hypothetical protein